MQPGGVLRHSGALPGMQQASLGLNNCKHHSEGSGAACVQLPGSHTSCNAASFPRLQSLFSAHCPQRRPNSSRCVLM